MINYIIKKTDKYIISYIKIIDYGKCVLCPQNVLNCFMLIIIKQKLKCIYA